MAGSDRQAHIFFIGGAADKEPYKILGVPVYGPHHVVGDYEFTFKDNLRLEFVDQIRVQTYYYSYLEKQDVVNKIGELQKQKNKTYIAILGHSYGASTAYRMCTEVKQNIDMLVTADPVGAGLMDVVEQWVELESLLKTKALVNRWVCVVNTSSFFEKANFIASVGGIWIKRKMSLDFIKKNSFAFIRCKNKAVYHSDLRRLMACKSVNSLSAEKLLQKDIKKFLNVKI